MADFVFNFAKGHVSEYVIRILANDPTNSAFVVCLLDASVADATAEDYDNLSLVLGDAGTTEATFTNYARKVITDPTRTVDDTNDRIDLDVTDITWTAAGNGTNNTIPDLLFTYDADTTGGADTDIIPCTQHDFVVTTDGSDLTAQVTNFFRAS